MVKNENCVMQLAITAPQPLDLDACLTDHTRALASDPVCSSWTPRVRWLVTRCLSDEAVVDPGRVRGLENL